jgi:hypothetical protein
VTNFLILLATFLIFLYSSDSVQLRLCMFLPVRWRIDIKDAKMAIQKKGIEKKTYRSMRVVSLLRTIPSIKKKKKKKLHKTTRSSCQGLNDLLRDSSALLLLTNTAIDVRQPHSQSCNSLSLRQTPAPTTWACPLLRKRKTEPA